MNELIKKLQKIGRDKHRYRVFEEFVTMVAISLQNSVLPKNSPTFQKLEKEYLTLINGYSKIDQQLICECFGELVILLDKEPEDVLGNIFMSMELGNERQGQFFTPDCVSQMMAKIQLANLADLLKEKPFITMLEPTCGAGGMILAVVKDIISQGKNPSQCLWVQAIDISRIAALMCFIQLSLWNVPAQIVVGNTLTLELREFWHTPAHLLNHWDAKLRLNDTLTSVKALMDDTQPSIVAPAEDQGATINAPASLEEQQLIVLDKPTIKIGEQIGFDFS